MRRSLVLFVLSFASFAAAGDLQQAIALYQQGKYADAESALAGVAGPEASAYRAASMAKQKKHAAAEPEAKAAVEALPTNDVAVAALGESLVGLKKYDEAATRLEAALAKREDIAYAHYWLGHTYYNKKQTDKMILHFDRFLKLAPKAPEAVSVQQLLAGLR